MRWLDRTVLRTPRMTLVVSDEQYRTILRKCPGAGGAPPFPDSSDTAWTSIFRNASGGVVMCIIGIRLDRKRTWAETAEMLAHEAVHVKQKMLQDLGEDAPGEEIEAYIVGEITGKLMAEYERQLRPARRKGS
jgi:hypothetical protein